MIHCYTGGILNKESTKNGKQNHQSTAKPAGWSDTRPLNWRARMNP